MGPLIISKVVQVILRVQLSQGVFRGSRGCLGGHMGSRGFVGGSQGPTGWFDESSDDS